MILFASKNWAMLQLVFGKLAAGVPCQKNEDLYQHQPGERLTQFPVLTAVPPAFTSAGTFAALRDQNQTEMNVLVRSMAYLCNEISQCGHPEQQGSVRTIHHHLR